MRFSPQRLRRAIGRRSYVEIGRATSVSRFTVARWINGKGEPSASQLADLAVVTRHRIDYFFEKAA